MRYFYFNLLQFYGYIDIMGYDEMNSFIDSFDNEYGKLCHIPSPNKYGWIILWMEVYCG